MQHNKAWEQKLFKLFGHFSLLLLLLSISLSAGSFEKFKTTQAKQYLTYRDQNDAAFSAYLKEQWKQYVSEQPQSLYEKQKPEILAPAV